MAIETTCPECGTRRDDASQPCPTCGAPPVRQGDKRAVDEEVRQDDLEPYVTLRYIAWLFKALAILMVIVIIGEVVSGLMQDGVRALMTLITETTRLIVLAAFMWAGGDVTLLLIDAGHDVRVSRILLGRINSELHRRRREREGQ